MSSSTQPDLRQLETQVLEGESIHSITEDHRQALIHQMGLEEEDVRPDTFRKESVRLGGALSRRISERHPDDRRVAAALLDWVREVEDYDAWDSLLSTFDFHGKNQLVRRGKVLFPGPLTSHWDEA